MKITLTADFIPEEKGFTGWINEIRGVVAYGETLEIAKEELIKILNIKLKAERERFSKNQAAKTNVITEEFRFAPTE